MRETDGEIFMALWRRGYTIEAIACMAARHWSCPLAEARVLVEDDLRDAHNEAAKHKRRTK